MLNLFKKKQVEEQTEQPRLKVVDVSSFSLNQGKSWYYVKDEEEFFDLINPEVIIFVDDDKTMVQESEVILICQFKGTSLPTQTVSEES